MWLCAGLVQAFTELSPTSSVPRSGPRNIRVYDPTTNTLTVNWEHAEGPVMQYRITYVQTTGDPIEEYVSTLIIPLNSTVFEIIQPTLIRDSNPFISSFDNLLILYLMLCRLQYQETETM